MKNSILVRKLHRYTQKLIDFCDGCTYNSLFEEPGKGLPAPCQVLFLRPHVKQ